MPRRPRSIPTFGAPRFTLLELLVVVAIIAVLAAILLPALGKARALAKRAVCMGAARQVHLGVTLYGEDTEYFPSQDQYRGYHEMLSSLNYTTRDLYTNEGGCPYGPGKYRIGTGDPIRAGTPGGAGAEYVSYGLNGLLQHGRGGPHTGTNGLFAPVKINQPRVINYSDRVAIITCSPSAYCTNQTSDNWRQLWHVLGYCQNGTWDIPDPEQRRHEGKGLPFTLADGHAEFVLAKVITGGASYWVVGSAPWNSTNGTYESIMDLSFSDFYRNKKIRD